MDIYTCSTKNCPDSVGCVCCTSSTLTELSRSFSMYLFRNKNAISRVVTRVRLKISVDTCRPWMRFMVWHKSRWMTILMHNLLPWSTSWLPSGVLAPFSLKSRASQLKMHFYLRAPRKHLITFYFKSHTRISVVFSKTHYMLYMWRVF